MITKGEKYMKKLLGIISLIAVLTSLTSCMSGGNADKGDDGYINDSSYDTTVTTERDDFVTSNDEKRIADTYDEYDGRINGLPSRIRRNVESGWDNFYPDRIANDMRRDIK